MDQPYEQVEKTEKEKTSTLKVTSLLNGSIHSKHFDADICGFPEIVSWPAVPGAIEYHFFGQGAASGTDAPHERAP